MALNKNIKKVLLNEISINRDKDIKDAINKVLRVRITYNDRKPHVISKTRGYNERYILPVAYGLTKSGKRAVRAFQSSGSTKRGVPKWKLFLLDNIISWNNGKKSFKKYGQQLIDLGLNTSGDKGMTTLYAITPIAKGDIQVAKDSKPITPEPITKNDIQPTTQSQISTIPNEPEISVDKMVPAQSKRTTSIDNNKNNSYFQNKVEAPPTQPIQKTDLVREPKTNEPQVSEPNTINAPETVPVSKTDIENINDVEKVRDDFNNIMSRMDNLYKDEEENIE